jgi:uncharacterized protein YraI
MTTSRIARFCAAAFAVVSVALLASIASAQQAYTSHRTSLRAGPDGGYPQVGWIGAGAVVYVNGCVNGYHWCDVSSGPYRGWVNARHLQYLYQNRRVGIYGNGAIYGFPLIGFALGSYWDNHYRNQAWYGNRSHWNDWRPGRPAPRYDMHPQQNFAAHNARVQPHVNHAPAQQFQQAQPHVQHQRQMQAPAQPVQREHARSQPQQQPQQQHSGNHHRDAPQR